MSCVECLEREAMERSPFCSTCDPAFWPDPPTIPIDKLIDKLQKYRAKHGKDLHVSFWFDAPITKEKLTYTFSIKEEEEIILDHGWGEFEKEIRFHLYHNYG